jgi:uncharacterized protein YyaL (SSP411 family)
MSPYLQQHAENPVDWYPWSQEALSIAKKEGKPILISIGYSAYHWCHVMEKESFEDPETAELMNRYFVNIKVDREERPDLDSIYMKAVQSLTGSAGWPMTVFLTPDGKPFYAGTYFPPVDRSGLPSFKKVLREVAEAYRDRRKDVENRARFMQNAIDSKVRRPTVMDLNTSPIENAFLQLSYIHDRIHGGFGGAPKFPQPAVLDFLLSITRYEDMSYSLKMVENTLTKMARGGIYDHLGGGFHRYSVDERWLVPHFEKMLYDNAQLALIYLHAYQITKNYVFRTVAEETMDYILREMRHPDGGFYSTQDADNDGKEGEFYIWTKREIDEILGKDGDALCRYYGISESGVYNGKNILSVIRESGEIASSLGISTDELQQKVNIGRNRLFEERKKRVLPRKDDKIIT